MYLIGHRRWWTPHGIFSCGTFSALATRLLSSCSAPNGHSQPQKAPRPQKIRATATEHHRMKISGSTRNEDQLKPSRREVVNVRTLTTDSWAWATQPSQNRVTTRYARRIRSKSSSRLTRASWKKKIRVSAMSIRPRTAIETVLLCHIRFHSGSVSSSRNAWDPVPAASPAAGGVPATSEAGPAPGAEPPVVYSAGIV